MKRNRKRDQSRQRCPNCGHWHWARDQGLCDHCLVAPPAERARRAALRQRAIADSKVRGSIYSVPGGLPSLGKRR
jgi:hypothetical protein